MFLSFNLILFAAGASLASGFTGTKYIFSFGDSYTQTGFDVSSTKPSSSNPLGNPAFPGYTTAGGANWLGDLVKTYNTSLTLAYNFAAGGATVDPSLVKPSITTKSLIEQLSQFSGSVASKPSYAPWTSDNSLFTVWIGINDVGNSDRSSPGEAALLGKVVQQYAAQVQKMYDAGGRHFVFLTVPPIQKAPVNLSLSSSASAALVSAISTFNSLVSNMTSSLLTNHPDASALVVDTGPEFEKALASPTSCGAGSNGASCYNSDGKTCLWYNNYHPGMAIHKLVAGSVAGSLNGSFF